MTTPEHPEPTVEEQRPPRVDRAEAAPAAVSAPAEIPAEPTPAAASSPPAMSEVAVPSRRVEHEPVYVPLAVSIGDGFKFGCGFFLALVVAMLIGFVLLAILFVLTSLFGLNLPISR